ncbi:EAP30/Vps36 family-domain-containing protein [Schizophyllum amplum]|uniref:Vacuolar protein-sorting-associated protein 36 n=1 Tax=Schizophyllum amplum TaxID=97359 RepID=A0A550CYI0_9AGAR|nr:EAP30/Vps36 family-domain-containing protein [Auriculariopsis ampla]
MALVRRSKPIDGSIPVLALLYSDEELSASQDGVGIYDGPDKSPNHQSGTVHLTSHRLIFVSDTKPQAFSFSIDLSDIRQTEYYAGLFTSSAKVTLVFDNSLVPEDDESADDDWGGWTCHVCDNRNPPGSKSRLCELCGVPKSVESTPRTVTPAPPASTPASTTKDRSCPACTFINHPSMRECEICGTALSLAAGPSVAASTPAVASNASSGINSNIVKISFRKSGDKPFYAALKRSLTAKRWEGAGAVYKWTATPLRDQNQSGIHSLLSTLAETSSSRASHLQTALGDLEALRLRSNEMVRVATEVSERLKSMNAPPVDTTGLVLPENSIGSTPATQAESELISSLSSLSLTTLKATPVTQDMIKDEQKWTEELARELASVLQGGGVKDKQTEGMMRDRGIIALDEVWGAWNRARGVALLPPATLLSTLPLLPSHTSPKIRSREFASGLKVLHTPYYSTPAFKARLDDYLWDLGVSESANTAEAEGEDVLPRPCAMTVTDIATKEQVTIALTQEMIEEIEAECGILRDDVSSCALVNERGIGWGADVRWWPNLLLHYVWDGQA